MSEGQPKSMSEILGVETTSRLEPGDALANGWIYLGPGDDKNTIRVNCMGLVWDEIIVCRDSGLLIPSKNLT